MAENLEDALRDGLAEDRPWMPEAILAREVVRLRSELSQAKADLAKAKAELEETLNGVADTVLAAQARAERAEADAMDANHHAATVFDLFRSANSRLLKSEALAKEQERVIEKMRELFQKLNGTDLQYNELQRIVAEALALTPEPAKEERCGCGHDLAHHMSGDPRSACTGDFPGGAKCGCFGWNPGGKSANEDGNNG